MCAPEKMTLFPFFLTLALILTPSCESNVGIPQQSSFHLLERTLLSLLKGLSFLENVKNHLTLDAMLGVVIVREQSNSLLRLLDESLLGWSKPNAQFFLIKRQLVELHSKASKVSMMMPLVWRQDPHYFQEIGGILRSNIWSTVRCHTKSLPLNGTIHESSSSVNLTLNESLSDFCMAEVLAGCRISSFCWVLLTEARFEGYPLAHQVFYLIVAKSMKCLSKMPPEMLNKVEHQLELFCSSMYQANLEMEAKNYPKEDQDLFSENIAFCGLNGFAPFRERYNWLEEIMKGQSLPVGCFTVDLRKLARLLATGQWRAKRRERVLPNGCSLHKTSMSLASMSVYMQQLIVQWLRHWQPQLDCLSLV